MPNANYVYISPARVGVCVGLVVTGIELVLTRVGLIETCMGLQGFFDTMLVSTRIGRIGSHAQVRPQPKCVHVLVEYRL